MHRLTAGIAALLGFWCCATVLAAPAASQSVDVRNLITVSQFHASGLDTLSPPQLEALNLWLGHYLASQPAASSTPVDVRNVITVGEFDRTGLDKLSPAQLAAFNDWLDQYLGTHRVSAAPLSAAMSPPVSQAKAPVAASFGADTMPRKENSATPERIETRLAGVFTGWSGNTVFTLENGQQWQQAGTGYFTNVRLDHPQVVIKKLGFGYLLTLPGHGETVFVRRIK
ncbi:MAG: hypothetical protein KGL98_01335 [Gammaproteobacteria bacterium]|nr:hypothetical protein [Gammaproteobacteria bacterium]MBU6508591.1 hypothetical protein [Gammaproteobacteria bacterium]MDE1983078.1 hypothetical protein [Gammaproteobacteria bacterium]MDE2107567.1 hypothetical protein [Gammaproteobacteria bacterium]MDE2459866.1 hypothetical protein [Gammaproteobacteria bacterium]